MQRYANRVRLCLLLCAACCIGCSSRVEADRRPAAATGAFKTPPIDSLFIYVRGSAAEEAHLSLRREAGSSKVTLVRPGRAGRPMKLLESIGPGQREAEKVVALLDAFDIWGMNAPDAAGASCKTTNGRRKCVIAHNDYSLVMLVASGGEVRVQRYIGLERKPSTEPARALGDYILAWARKREIDTRVQ